MNTELCTVNTVQCTMNTVQCTVNTVQCTVNKVQFTLNKKQCVQKVLNTLRCKVYIELIEQSTVIGLN